MQRVAIIGPCGAGKSMLAVRLGPILGLPVIHLDAEHWLPGWTEPPQPQWREKNRRLMAREHWIIDGNYGDSMEARIIAADTIVFLDFPRWRCVWRIIKRVMHHRGSTRPDMGKDCPERWDWEFMEYVWNYHREHRPKILDRLSRVGNGKTLFILRDQSEIDQFVKEMSSRGHS